MSVAAILNEKGSAVITIEPDRTLAEAAALMASHRIGAAVVVDGRGRLLGVVSERDVVRALAETGAEAVALVVRTVMTRDVVTCGPGETINELMVRMTRGRFRHVPVMEDGRLVGIVSIGDVVKERVEEIEHESEALRDYIRTA